MWTTIFLSLVIHFIFFFFSSRRRHTSFSRDWSSDVCSSDLFGEMRRAVANALMTSKPVTLTSTTGTSTCWRRRSEEHTSELQSRENLVCRLLLEKKNNSVTDVRVRLNLARSPKLDPVLLITD